MRWGQLTGSDSYCRLRVEADWVEVAADYEDIMKAYEHVRIPGFRPGKVPRSVIEGRFQKQILEDFSQRVAARLGKEALKQANIETIGPVELRDVESGKGKPVKFIACYLPMPEITLPDLGSLNIDAGNTDPRDQISVRLLELVAFEVPDDLVWEELARDGVGDVGPESGAWRAASERIRLLMILKKIAKQEGIDVEGADLDRRIAEKAKEFGTSPAALRSELDEGDGISRLRDLLLAESTLDYLIERNCNQ